MTAERASAPASAAMAYRPEIDGLRGIAVLSVILFHADPAWLPGGYAGVDVFFVISGYLITRIVSTELQAGRFGAARFFARRIRRLVPVLLLVLGCCLVPAWTLLLPRQLEDFAGSVWAVSALVANLFFWRQTGYFSAGAEQHPLIHTWSLSIEEQYYLLFAFVFPLCWRLFQRRLPALLLATALLSLLACELASRLAPAFGFYGLPFRAWELLAGATLGLAASRADPRLDSLRRHGRPLAALGLALLGLTLLAYDDQTPFPSLYALLPVLGTVLLLAVHDTAAGINRILAWRPLVAVGLVSYSAYLWHQPVFTFTRLAFAQPLSDGLLVALVLVTLGLSALSWRYVEQPLRDRQRSSGLKLAGVVVLGLLFVNGAAWWLRSQDGAAYRLNPEAVRLLAFAQQKNPRQMECMARTEQAIAPAEGCLLGSADATPSIAVLGDSHADALFVALDRRLKSAGLAARFLAHSGCPPVPGLYRTDIGIRSTCDAHQRTVRDFLAADPHVDTLIVASRWAAYLEGRPFDNGEGGRTGGPSLDVSPLASARWYWRASQTEDDATTVAGLYTAGLHSLLDARRRVVLVYPIPEVGWLVPETLARRAWRAPGPTSDLSTSQALYLERNRRSIEALDAIRSEGPADTRLLRIHPDRLLCDRPAAPGRCMAQIDGQPLYYDDNHLNTDGARMLVEQIGGGLRWPGVTD